MFKNLNLLLAAFLLCLCATFTIPSESHAFQCTRCNGVSANCDSLADLSVNLADTSDDCRYNKFIVYAKFFKGGPGWAAQARVCDKIGKSSGGCDVTGNLCESYTECYVLPGNRDIGFRTGNVENGQQCDCLECEFSPPILDDDFDSVSDNCDNCEVYNPRQLDEDNNGIGDVCEPKQCDKKDCPCEKGKHSTNIVTGGVNSSQLDVSIKGYSLDLNFNRFYNSWMSKVGAFGMGWTYGYAIHVRELLGSSQIELFNEKGEIIFYTRQADGSYKTDKPGEGSTLAALASGFYSLTKENKVKYIFDDSSPVHKLVEVWGPEALSAPSITLNYSVAGQVTIRHASGRSLTLVDANLDGKINEARIGASVINYVYNGDYLTETHYPDGSAIFYAYDSAHNNLESVTDNNGNVLEKYVYDSTGKVIESDDSTGHFTYTYSGETVTSVNLRDNTQSVTLKKHGVTVSTTGPCPNCAGSSERVWDNKNNLVIEKNANGNYIRRYYDDIGNVVKSIHVNKTIGPYATNASPFTYNFDGSVIDPVLWTWITRQGSTLFSQNGTLVIDKKASPSLTASAGRIMSNFNVSGDFEVTIDYGFDSLLWGIGANRYLYLGVEIGDKRYWAYRAIGGYDTMRFAVWDIPTKTINIIEQQGAIDNWNDGTIKKLRLRRVGTQIEADWYANGQWYGPGATNPVTGVSLDQAKVSLFYYTSGISGEYKVWFDNLEIQAYNNDPNFSVEGDIYTPIPGAPVSTYGYDNPLLPKTQTSVSVNSLKDAQSKTAIFDYDDPNGAGGATPVGNCLPPSSYNLNPTTRLHRIIENGWVDADGDGALDTCATFYIENDYDDATGQIISRSERTPAGTAPTLFTTYAYYTNGDLETVSNPVGHTVLYSAYDDFGNPTQIHDPNGIITDIASDRVGRTLTQTIDGQFTTTNAYTTESLASVTLPGGGVIEYEYASTDSRLAEMRRRTIPSGPVIETRKIEYDNSGPNEKIITRIYDGDSATGTLKRISSTMDALEIDVYNGGVERQVTISIDGGTLETDPDVTVTRDYADKTGNVVTRVLQLENDASGNARQQVSFYTYNQLDQLIEVSTQLFVNQTLDSELSKMQYAYDIQGNLTTVRVYKDSANFAVTAYSYDDFGNLVRVDSPDSGVTTYAYDAAGNVLSKTFSMVEIPMNVVTVTTSYSYDGLNRLVAVDYESDGADDVTYIYDEAVDGDGFDHGYGVGRLTTALDANGSTKYKYDSRGNVLVKRSDVAGTVFAMSYAYDANGNVTSITYPSGRVVAYERTDPDRVTRVTVDGVVVADNIQWDPFGDWNSMTLGNGLNAVYQRDLRGLPARVAYPPHLDYNYSVDNVGNITQIDDLTNPAWLRDYSYDALGRLVSADNGTYSKNRAFSYDDAGNRLSLDYGAVNETFDYYAGTNRLSVVDPPVEVAGTWYMSEEDFDALYHDFRHDYREFLEDVKHWAKKSRVKLDRHDDDDDDAEHEGDDDRPFDPAAELAGLSEKWFVFNVTYGVDAQWWLDLLKSDDYANDLAFQFMSMALANNVSRSGARLTEDESLYVEELAKALRKLDPPVPSNWLVIGPTDPMWPYLNSVYVGPGGTVSTVSELYYAPNGDIYATLSNQGGRLIHQYNLWYDHSGRPYSVYVDQLPAADYYYNYMSQRVMKSTWGPFEARRFAYDLAGNMVAELSNTVNREYVYLGGHRLAAIEPAGVILPGPGGCAGGGCSTEGADTWETLAIGGFIFCIPVFVVLALKYRRDGDALKLVGFALVISGGIIAFSYVSAPSQTPNFRVYYYLNDHLDTPMRVTDQSGAVVWSGYYDPFGKLAYEEGTFEQNFRFPGQYHDRETGLYYNWNRYYVPELGRYNRADPFDIPSVNPYSYVSNKPIRYFDYFGLFRQPTEAACRNSAETAQHFRRLMENELNKAYKLGLDRPDIGHMKKALGYGRKLRREIDYLKKYCRNRNKLKSCQNEVNNAIENGEATLDNFVQKVRPDLYPPSLPPFIPFLPLPSPFIIPIPLPVPLPALLPIAMAE